MSTKHSKLKIIAAVVILGYIALFGVLMLWHTIYYYRNVTQQEVLSSLKLEQSDILTIKRQDGDKGERIWYSAYYVMELTPEAARKLRAHKTPFALCSEKNCNIGEWWQGRRSTGLLKGDVQCAVRSYDEAGGSVRNDHICIGDGTVITYDVLVPYSP